MKALICPVRISQITYFNYVAVLFEKPSEGHTRSLLLMLVGALLGPTGPDDFPCIATNPVDRRTDRQSDRQTDRQTDRHTHTHTHTHTHMYTHTLTRECKHCGASLGLHAPFSPSTMETKSCFSRRCHRSLAACQAKHGDRGDAARARLGREKTKWRCRQGF